MHALFFSKDGEYVYTIPDLLPITELENILQTVKQFLNFRMKIRGIKKKTK